MVRGNNKFYCVGAPSQDEVTKHFKTIDPTNTGTIKKSDLRKVLQFLDPVKWTDYEVDRLFRYIDTDMDDELNFDEFAEWCYMWADPGLVGFNGEFNSCLGRLDEYVKAHPAAKPPTPRKSPEQLAAEEAARKKALLDAAAAKAAEEARLAGKSAIEQRRAAEAAKRAMAAQLAEEAREAKRKAEADQKAADLAAKEAADAARREAGIAAAAAKEEAYMKGGKSKTEMQMVRKLFRKFDKDDSGEIDKTELSSMLVELDPLTWTANSAEDLFRCIDFNGDEGIELHEFMDWIFKPDYNVRGGEGMLAAFFRRSVNPEVKAVNERANEAVKDALERKSTLYKVAQVAAASAKDIDGGTSMLRASDFAVAAAFAAGEQVALHCMHGHSKLTTADICGVARTAFEMVHGGSSADATLVERVVGRNAATKIGKGDAIERKDKKGMNRQKR
eukprot:TRINITY_DN110812_c0_g1_i1.p1 TRINITY_DN110812_c0_g1~~TRINITY_DN110812_c0_g1_i1.p1  ORF type:complete len:446 (+),score=150.37 TRINITY_DN110812_c0_g1_i1:58-1395(+)